MKNQPRNEDGQYIHDVVYGNYFARKWASFKRKLCYFLSRVWFWTKVATSMAVFAMIFTAFGAFKYSTHTTHAEVTTVTKEVQLPLTETPVMARIAMCESHQSQTCTAALAALHMCKSSEIGQTLHKPNKNGTVDTGYMQINSIWGAQAAKLGYNLDIEADNRAFAMWLYANKGTDPWYSSSNCWNK